MTGHCLDTCQRPGISVMEWMGSISSKATAHSVRLNKLTCQIVSRETIELSLLFLVFSNQNDVVSGVWHRVWRVPLPV